MFTFGERTIRSINKYHAIAFATVLLFAAGLFVVLYTQNNVKAADLNPINHTYSSAIAGEASDHTVTFTAAHEIPVGGAIQFLYPTGTVTTGVDYTDVDLLVGGVQRTLGTVAGTSTDAVSVYSDNVYIEIGVPIANGSMLELRVGQNATHQSQGIDKLINPQTNGPKLYRITVYINIPGVSDIGSHSVTITGGINTGGSLTVTHSPSILIYSAPISRTISFSTVNKIPVGGKIRINFWMNMIMGAELNYSDVDMEVNSAERTLGATATGSTDGVDAQNYAMTITLGSSEIPAGANVTVKIGSNALYDKSTGHKKYINPPIGYGTQMSPSIYTETSTGEQIDNGNYSATFIEANTVQFASASSQGMESVTSVYIPLTLAAVADTNFTVNYGVTGGTAATDMDYTTPYAGTVTIPAGTTTAAFLFPILNDAIEEPDETIVITLSAAELGTNTTHTYTILNDDTTAASPEVTILQTSGSTDVTEGGATDTFSMFLVTQPTSNVSVTLSQGESKVTASPSNLVFTPSGFMSPQIITVTATDDAVVEGPHTATLAYTATSTDSHYNGISISSVVVHITDNDVAPPVEPVTPPIVTGTSTPPGDTPPADKTTPPIAIKFSDVDGKLKKADADAVYQVVGLMVKNKTYKAPAKFQPNGKTTTDFAIRIALAIAGKSCGEKTTAATCRAAAIKAKLVKDAIVVNGEIVAEAELTTKNVTRAEFYRLILRASKLGFIDIKTITPAVLKKNLPKDAEFTSTKPEDLKFKGLFAQTILTAREYKIITWFKGTKSQASKPFSRTAAASIVSKLLAAMEKSKPKGK